MNSNSNRSMVTKNDRRNRESRCGLPEDDDLLWGPKNWESRGIMVEVQKSLDSNEPAITIDLASTLGTSIQLPLAVKKAVRFWFGPKVKTKTDVVRYINQACRRNGFKISTLSNSKQGLDRRAQLVCSRGIVARQPRGKSSSVQTTTTRPVSVEEKCPFSLTVYECRKSGRWYLRKFGNGSRMHCGHCQLLPDQVGVRRYQSLTERNGSTWCERARENPGIQSGENVLEICKSVNDETSPGMERQKMNVGRGNSLSPPTLTNIQISPQSGANIKNPIQQIQEQNQKQFLGYIANLRNRVLYRDYADRLIMERARRMKYIEAGLNGFGFQGIPYLNCNFNEGLLEQTTGNKISINQISDCAKPSTHPQTRDIPSLIRVERESPSVDSKSSSVSSSINRDQSSCGSSAFAGESNFDRYQNKDNRKRKRDDTSLSTPSKITSHDQSTNGAEEDGDEIMKAKIISNNRPVPDNVGSHESAMSIYNGRKVEVINFHERTIEQDLIASDQCPANTEGFDDLADEYAMLRPMAIHDYSTGQS